MIRLPFGPLMSFRSHQEGIERSLLRVARSGIYLNGKEVRSFEKEFADYIGRRFCVAVGSGTDAIRIAIESCGIEPGDGVIIPSFTASPTAIAVVQAKAVPLLSDVRRSDMLLQPLDLLRWKRAKGVIPVHLFGAPCDMQMISHISKNRGLKIIEDCAQSCGAHVSGKKVGTWGVAGAFSFYPTKTIGSLGDAGAIVTDDRKVADRARSLREFGWQKRYVSDFVGVNSHMDELQAAVLKEKLTTLDMDYIKRREIAALYGKLLYPTPLELPNSLKFGHCFQSYVVRHHKRNELRKFLESKGIWSFIHYPLPIHRQKAFDNVSKKLEDLYESERSSKRCLSLPIYPEMTRSQVIRIAEEILKFFKIRK